MKNKKKLIIIISIAIILIIGIAISIILLTKKETKTNENSNQSQEVQNDINNNNEDNNTINDEENNEENKDEVKKQTIDKNLEQKDNKESGSTSNKEQKSNNTNSKSNSNTKSNNSNSSNTQTNTQNTSSNLLPVGKTYSLTKNGGKITILDGNKARLDMFGNSWTTDIKFDGNQYKFSFKKRHGSGRPTYFVNSNALPILTYTFMKGEENKSTIDAREINYSKSFSGAIRSDFNFSEFNWNGTYSCKTNEDIGNDCLLWAQGYFAQPKNEHIIVYDRVWILDNNFDILGFVVLQYTDGNIIQLYK